MFSLFGSGLSRLGIKDDPDYFQLQDEHKKTGVLPTITGESFDGNGKLEYFSPEGLRTDLCDLGSLHESLKKAIDDYLLVSIPLKSDGDHINTNGQFHMHVLYRYDENEYFGITYYPQTGKVPSFELDIKHKIDLEKGTAFQYYKFPDEIPSEDKKRISEVIETIRAK